MVTPWTVMVGNKSRQHRLTSAVRAGFTTWRIRQAKCNKVKGKTQKKSSSGIQQPTTADLSSFRNPHRIRAVSKQSP